ncbi:sensor histidine kinase [Enterococcus malodoratus]|uniref:sensor histidine kinase n=1 Tax=Enterococcus malodoratus TaxID=71451 RepID=UPI0039AE9F14
MNYKQIFYFEYSFLLITGLILLVIKESLVSSIIFLLISLIVIAPSIFFENEQSRFISLVSLLLLSSIWPSFLFFLPGTLKIAFQRKSTLLLIVCFLFIVPLFIRESFSPLFQLIIFSLSMIAILLNLKEQSNRTLEKSLLEMQDESWEKQKLLEKKNAELLDSQESLLNLQISEERNRIPRDVHDNVGHFLSSAIIQVCAIETINQKQQLIHPLSQLKSTINDGMSNIRESVHNLHHESVNLDEISKLLIQDFHFCPVEFRGEIPRDLSNQQNKVLLMVLKEALSNIMKHSQASFVSISFERLTAFYRIEIKNDGVIATNNQTGSGIGIMNMRQRMNEVGGKLSINTHEDTFSLIIFLSKEENI